MRFLLVLILIKILEFSRFNLTNREVPRLFYDLLSFGLLLAFFGYLLLHKRTDAFERKLESAFQEAVRGWVKVLDVVLILLVAIVVYKTVGILYSNPIRCATGDMLPIIRGAGEYLLSGDNPFTKTYCPWELNYMYAPLMMVYYLPAILAKIDIRFISLLCFIGIVILAYFYHRKKGRPLTGFLISVVIITSGLFPFLLISVHTFPYLFVFSCFLFAVSEENDGMLFFTLALAMTSRRLFWLFVPLILVYIIKERKIRLSNIGYFGMGALIGISPLLLFSNTYVLSLLSNLSRQSQGFMRSQGGNSVLHSLGFSYYLSGHRRVAVVLFLLIFSLLVFLALKYLSKKSLWIFLSLAILSITFVQVHTRAQEYYFLPLLVIILFAPIKAPDLYLRKKHLVFLTGAVVLIVVCFSVVFPFFSENEIVVDPIRGYKKITAAGFITSRGFLELSVGTNFQFRKNKNLIILIRRDNFQENQPALVEVAINGKRYFSGYMQTRRIKLKLDEKALKKYFYMGGNDMEIELLPRGAFAVRIQ